MQSADNRHAAGKRASYLRMLLSRDRCDSCTATSCAWAFSTAWSDSQVCTLTGLSSFVKQVRLWELEHALPQPDPETGETGNKTTAERHAA